MDIIPTLESGSVVLQKRQAIANKILVDFPQHSFHFTNANLRVGGSASLGDATEKSDIDISVLLAPEERIKFIKELETLYERVECEAGSSIGSFGKFKINGTIYDFLDGHQLETRLPLIDEVVYMKSGRVYFEHPQTIWAARFVMAFRGSKKQRERFEKLGLAKNFWE